MKEKPKIICLFGFMATGKLTIGKALSKETEINLSHNHLLNDYVDSLLNRGTLARVTYIEKLRFEGLELAISENNSIIITHAYSSNFTSLSGMNDLSYLEKIEQAVTEAGGIFYGVHLLADNDILIDRVSNQDRNNYRKLTDTEKMKKALLKSGEQKAPNIKNYLAINTGDITVKESVEIIIKEIEKQSA